MKLKTGTISYRQATKSNVNCVIVLSTLIVVLALCCNYITTKDHIAASPGDPVRGHLTFRSVWLREMDSKRYFGKLYDIMQLRATVTLALKNTEKKKKDELKVTSEHQLQSIESIDCM